MNRFIALLFAAFACTSAFSASDPASIRSEITALLVRLGESGCQFNRNGSWHSSAEARDHLARKLEYIEKRSALVSAEQFIELAASKSSMSGNPYLVRCGEQAAVSSQSWLMSQLQSIRSAANGEAK